MAGVNGPYTIETPGLLDRRLMLSNGDGEPLAVFFDEADAEYIRGLLEGIWMLRTKQLHHAKISVEALETVLRLTIFGSDKGQGN